METEPLEEKRRSNRRVRLVGIIIVLAVLAGVAAGLAYRWREKRRVAWNDNLVAAVTGAYARVNEFHEAFFSEFEKDDTDYRELQALAAQSQKSIRSFSKTIDAMTPVRGGEELYGLAREFMDLLKLLLARSEEFASVPAQTPFNDDRFTALASQIDDLWGQIGRKKIELQESQTRMAKEFGFGLEGS